jgi:hypothetical protein
VDGMLRVKVGLVVHAPATDDGAGAPGPPATGAVVPVPRVDPTWERLEDQLDWYDRKSMGAQRAYKRIKLVEIAAAAAVPPLIALEVPAAISASLGVIVVVLEAVQQLYQFQSNWITYRSTAEALKHERYLYLAEAGPYGDEHRHRVLAERIEGLISQEHAKWTESRRTRSDDESKQQPAEPAQ